MFTARHSYRFLGQVCHVLADGTIVHEAPGHVLHVTGDRRRVLGVYADLDDFAESLPATMAGV